MKLITLSFLIILLITACTTHYSESDKLVLETLKSNNQNVFGEGQVYLEELKEMAEDPSTSESYFKKANELFAKAKTINSICLPINSKIESLKSDKINYIHLSLLKELNLFKVNLISELHKNNRNIADDKLDIDRIDTCLNFPKYASLIENHTKKEKLFILLALQNKVLTARSIALFIISMKIGCGADWDFTNIEPFITGPNVAMAGDKIQLKIAVAAYDRFKKPNIKLFTKGKVEKIVDGFAYVNYDIPNCKSLLLSGEILIQRNNGTLFPRNWKHELKVISKN